MDVCCGLGTVSLAGQALTKAVKAAAPDDKRGIEVSTSSTGLLPIAIRAAGELRIISELLVALHSSRLHSVAIRAEREPCIVLELFTALLGAQDGSIETRRTPMRHPHARGYMKAQWLT